MFGSLFHLAVDALLVSAFLAGVRRSTGLTYVELAVLGPRSPPLRPVLSQVPNKDVRREWHPCFTTLSDQASELLRTYLEIGTSRVPHLALRLDTGNRRVCLRLCRSHLWGDPARRTSKSPANPPRSAPAPSNASSSLCRTRTIIVYYSLLYFIRES